MTNLKQVVKFSIWISILVVLFLVFGWIGLTVGIILSGGAIKIFGNNNIEKINTLKPKKTLPYWLRGIIVGSITATIYTVIGLPKWGNGGLFGSIIYDITGNYASHAARYICHHFSHSTGYFSCLGERIIFFFLFSLLEFAICGAIIGLIVGKIKPKRG